MINDGDLFLLKIPGVENPADMLTKTVTTTKLRLYIASTGLCKALYTPKNKNTS